MCKNFAVIFIIIFRFVNTTWDLLQLTTEQHSFIDLLLKHKNLLLLTPNDDVIISIRRCQELVEVGPHQFGTSFSRRPMICTNKFQFTYLPQDLLRYAISIPTSLFDNSIQQQQYRNTGEVFTMRRSKSDMKVTKVRSQSQRHRRKKIRSELI